MSDLWQFFGAKIMEYAGDLSVMKTWDRLVREPTAVLIDVRTAPEWNYVGLPDLSSLDKQVICSEWQFYPGMEQNPGFAAEVEQAGVAKDTPIFLICRSGARSKHAAVLLTGLGYQHCYNVTGGFEGDKDAHGHRGNTGSWKHSGLPWTQG